MKRNFTSIRYSKDNLDYYGFKRSIKHQRVSIDETKGSLLASSIKVNKDLFPVLHQSIEKVSQELSLQQRFETYIVNDQNHQAYCLSNDSGKDFIIVISAGLINYLSNEELEFVIGHEIGHHIFAHYEYPSHSDEENLATNLALLQLNRAAEISVDRIGFLSCQSLEVCLRTIIKSFTGLESQYINFDFSTFINQAKELEKVQGHKNQIYSSHPSFLLRARALLFFTMSEPYYQFIGKSGTAPLSKSKLDTNIENDFNKATGFYLHDQKNEALSDFRMWAILRLIIIDFDFSKEEEKLFSDIFGKDKMIKAKNLLDEKSEDRKISIIENKLNEALDQVRNIPKDEKEMLISELEGYGSLVGGNKLDIVKTIGFIANLVGIERAVSLKPYK